MAYPGEGVEGLKKLGYILLENWVKFRIKQQNPIFRSNDSYRTVFKIFGQIFDQIIFLRNNYFQTGFAHEINFGEGIYLTQFYFP